MSVSELDTKRNYRLENLSSRFDYESHLTDNGTDELKLSGRIFNKLNYETKEPNKILDSSCKKSYQNISIQCTLQEFDHADKINSSTQYEPIGPVTQEIQCSYSDSVQGNESLPSKSLVCAECIANCSYPRNSVCHVISSSTYKVTCNKESGVRRFDKNDNNYCKQNNSSVQTSHKYLSTEVCGRKFDVITSRNRLHFPQRMEQKCNQYPMKRKEYISSSSTSGIAETISTRSEISQVNEGSLYSNKTAKRKKKHLWNPPSDNNTISDGDDSSVMNNFFDSKSKVTEINCDSDKMTSVKIKKKYSTEEQLQIIKFIAEKNLFSYVGGVCIWHDMEAEIGIGRSWQSLKENFRKQILPNIEKYHLSSSVERLFCKIRK